MEAVLHIGDSTGILFTFHRIILIESFTMQVQEFLV